MEKNKQQGLMHASPRTLPEALYTRLASVVPFAPPYPQVRQIARYTVSGVAATFTHLGLTYLLTEAAAVYYVLSSTIGFMVGFGVSFTLQKFWTFQNHSLRRAPWQLGGHMLLQGGMLGVNGAGVFLLTEFLGLWYMVSQLLVLAVVACISFLVYKFVIFA